MDCFRLRSLSYGGQVASLAMTYDDHLLQSNLLLAVGDTIDRAVPVVGDQDRAVLELQYIDRPADILIVFEEPGDERLLRLYGAVLVQLDHEDITANFRRAVPGAVPRDNDRVLVGLREHAACIEAHPERGGMRAHQGNRRGIVGAGFSPAEFGIDDIALQAIGRTEVLADLGHAVELILRHVFRHPVASVVGEVELLGLGIPVEADGVADAPGDHFGAGAVEIDAADLAVGVVVQHVVAGLSDRDVQLVIGTDSDELPAVGFVLRQIVVDHGRFRRIVDDVLDLFDLGHLRQFGDVERAVLEGDAIRTVETGGHDLDRTFAVLVDDGSDLVEEAAADEHVPLSPA